MSKRRKVIEDTISYIHTHCNSKAEIRYNIRLMLFNLEILESKEKEEKSCWAKEMSKGGKK